MMSSRLWKLPSLINFQRTSEIPVFPADDHLYSPRSMHTSDTVIYCTLAFAFHLCILSQS
jgi:hypothetical protein